MSQAGAITVSGGGGGGSLNTLTPDQGGVVSPVANNINVFGQSTTINNDNGIRTFNGGAGELDVRLTNRITGSVTTSDATPTTIASFSLDAVATVYTFDIQIACFNSTDINGDGYFISGTARTDGVTATLCGTPDKIVNEEVIDTADANMIVSGNTVIIQATGIAGKTHRWRTVATYVQVV